MKSLTLAAALVALTCATATAQAEDPFGPSGATSSKVDDVARALSLTPAQKRQMRSIKDNLRKAEVKTRAAIEIVRIDLSSELDKPVPSRAKVGGYIDKISKLEAEARKAKVYASLEIRKLLNKNQWQQLKGLHGGKRHRHRHSMRHLERQIERELRARKHEIRARTREAREKAREAMRRARDEMRRARKEARRAYKEAMKEAKGRSKVRVQTSPSGARIYVDGKMVGTSPLELRLRPGRHRLKIEKKGYKSKVTVVRAKDGESMSLSVQLAK